MPSANDHLAQTGLMLEQKKKGGDTGVKNIASRMTQHGDWRNQVTVALWMIALSSHLILMPMLIRELYRDFVQKKSEMPVSRSS